MKDEEILKKAIEKAVKNGFKEDGIYEDSDEIMSRYEGYESHDIEHLIFSHSFAKAFWGKGYATQGDCGHIFDNDAEHRCKENDGDISTFTHTDLAWKLHLQRMVLEENPIKYLEQFL